MQPAHIIVTLHGNNPNYVTALAALYASIRTHTALSLQFWIIHDDSVPEAELARLDAYISERDAVHLVDVGHHPRVADLGRECSGSVYSPAVLWRVYATELCAADKAILLDADLIFLCDIAELWNVDLGHAPLAASLRGKPWPDEYHAAVRTAPERYFRMGVSVLNLAYMRQDSSFIDEREDFVRKRLPAINALAHLQEQSLFNYFFSHAAVPLDINLCPVAHFNTTAPEAVGAMLERVRRPSRVILDIKGWLQRSPFDYFYWSYLLMTPWNHAAYAHLARLQRENAADAGAPPQGPTA